MPVELEEFVSCLNFSHQRLCSEPRDSEDFQHTNSHHYQETSAESSKVDYCVASILHKIIWVRASSADPVGQRCDDIRCNDK